MNRRDWEDFVMERFDRAFAIVDWVNAYTSYSLRNLPIVRSDYGPILLDFEINQSFKRTPFRFERMWMTHLTCKEVVQKAWNFKVVGSKAYQLKNKLSNVRKDLISWNKQVFGKVENEIWPKQAQLQTIQNSIHTVDDVKKKKKKKKLFREELETLMHREELMWSQKVRCNWVVLGDRNTRYFQTVVKQRRVRSRILQLNTDDGEVLKIREELNNRSYNTSSNLMGGPLQLMLTIFLRRSEPCLFHRYPTNRIWLLPHQ